MFKNTELRSETGN